MDFLSPEINEAVFGEGEAVLTKTDDGVLVSSRAAVYSSLAIRPVKALGSKPAYASRFLVRLVPGAAPIRLTPYHKLTMDYLDVRETAYTHGATVTVTDKAWVELVHSTDIPAGSTILDMIVYFIQDNGTPHADILVREASVEECEPSAPEVRTREYRPLPVQTKRLVGTIRWDAFSESTPDGKLPCDQVARVLSPKEYHHQAPFFSCVDEEGKISFPPYTMETWEEERLHALAGGLDYFAYLWYETTDKMSEPRKMHLQSPNKDTILMCGILEGRRSEKTMNELYEAMKDSCYLRLDGRPVLFLYGIDRWSKESVERVLEGARKAGVSELLYVVGMSNQTSPFVFMANAAKGIDALSWYSVGARKKDETYEELKTDCEEQMRKAAPLCRKTGVDLIPAFTCGRDTRARIRTGVSWCSGDPKAEKDEDKPYRNMYALPPTEKELHDHIAYTVRFTEEHRDVTKPYMICSYGWNEHEEGGWLCPTLVCGEDGVPATDAFGKNVPDRSRLDILKTVLNGK